jgi:hypothetical protein
MRRMMVAAGLAALALGQACAQQNAPHVKELDKPPPLTLRTRMPLPASKALNALSYGGRRGIIPLHEKTSE